MAEMEITTEAAMVDMMAGRLTQYLCAVGTVLVFYDGFLTIEDEVSLILSRLWAVSVYVLLADALCLARTLVFPKSIVLHQPIPKCNHNGISLLP